MSGAVSITHRRSTVTVGTVGNRITVPSRPSVVVTVGTQGPAGAKGDDGAPGSAYTHTQSVAASSWTVTHNLGYRPAVSVLTDGGQVRLAEVTHLSVNQCRVDFAAASTGSVVVS